MTGDMLLIAVIISLFFIFGAWQLLKIAVAEYKNTKAWPIIPLVAGIVFALLSILSIYSAINMN